MILYTTVTLITVFAGLYVQREATIHNTTRQQLMNRICLAAIFGVLFLLCALRIEVGNDYITYVQNAHEIYVGGITVTEPGYNYVVKLLFTICGGEYFLLIFAFFGFITIFFFLKSMYDQSEIFAMSFFLFMTLGIYFRSFNTVRYYMVLALTLFSLRYVVRKEYAKFVILILIAAFFHKSVLVVIPMYIICNRAWKKWFYGLIAVGTVAMYLLKDYIMQIALKLYPSYQDTVYLTQDIGIKASMPALVRCALVLVLCVICYKEAIANNKANTLYFNMTVMSVALYIGGSFIPMVSRFGYYLITAQILLVPGIYICLEGKKKKYALIGIIAMAVLYFIYFLFTASKPGIAVLPYRSWLFRDLEWNNIEDMLIYTNR